MNLWFQAVLISSALVKHFDIFFSSTYVWLQLLLPDACLLRFAFHSGYPVAAQIKFCWLLPANLITGILLRTPAEHKQSKLYKKYGGLYVDFVRKVCLKTKMLGIGCTCVYKKLPFSDANAVL